MQDDAEFEEWEGVLDQIVVKLVHFAEEGVECNQRSHAQFICNNYKGPFVCTRDIGFYVVQLDSVSSNAGATKAFSFSVIWH